MLARREDIPRFKIRLDEALREEASENLQHEVIASFVQAYRHSFRISPTPGPKWEMSCIMCGEGNNLLYRQLVATTNTTGYWSEMEDPQMRKLVLEQIAKDMSGLEEDPRYLS
ncbi:MAG: hypothetical protein ACE5DM_05530 [Candidatus Nanoarchaeia archaeon]